MHEEVLSPDQKDLLPLLDNFGGKFYLAEGTAIALQLGHRRSIDFDLLTPFDIKALEIRNQIVQKQKMNIEAVLVDQPGEFTVVVNKVKITFLKYPFNIPHKLLFKKNYYHA
jgi:hypothetical protein